MTHLRSAGLALALACTALPAAGQTLQQDVAPSPAEAPTAEPRVLQMPPAEAAPPVVEPREPAPVPPASGQAAQPDIPQDEPAPDPKARFQFVRVGDNVLKLDGDTGAVSLCDARGAGWSCRVLPEDRVALEEEIARLEGVVGSLRGEIGNLKGEIGSLNGEIAKLKVATAPPPPPPPRPPAPTPSEGTSIELRMPTAEDYERARVAVSEAMSEAWRKLVEMVARIQSDMMRKG